MKMVAQNSERMTWQQIVVKGEQNCQAVRETIERLGQEKGIGQSVIRRETGISDTPVRNAIKKLTKEGVIQRVGEGNDTKYRWVGEGGASGVSERARGPICPDHNREMVRGTGSWVCLGCRAEQAGLDQH